MLQWVFLWENIDNECCYACNTCNTSINVERTEHQGCNACNTCNTGLFFTCYISTHVTHFLVHGSHQLVDTKSKLHASWHVIVLVIINAMISNDWTIGIMEEK